jgi:hypothetical protein
MVSGSMRLWSVLVVAVQCVIGTLYEVQRNGEVHDKLQERLRGTGSSSASGNLNIDIWNFQPWVFIRFREVQNCYEQFAIEQNQYGQANDRGNYKKIHPPLFQGVTYGQVESFRLLAWYNIAMAPSEASFMKSYFYLLVRHYCDSKARFPEQMLAVNGHEPYRKSHIRVLERFISYLQNSFYLNVYFVPKITANNEIEQTGQIHPRIQDEINIELTVMITFFVQYCQQVETVEEHQESRVSKTHQAFSGLLDALNDISNARIPPSIKRDGYVETIFPGIQLIDPTTTDMGMAVTFFKDMTMPVYVYRTKAKSLVDKLVVLMNGFEVIHGMCTPSSSPGLDELAGELNRKVKRLPTEPDGGLSLLNEYVRAARCPGMLKQRSSTVANLDRDAKGILSTEDIREFKKHYERTVPDCHQHARELRPTGWPKCEIPTVILSGMPVKPLPKADVTSMKVDNPDKIQTELAKIMDLDEFNYYSWFTLYVMVQWVKNLNSDSDPPISTATAAATAARVSQYIKPYTQYWEKKRVADRMKSNPKINQKSKGELQSDQSENVISLDNSHPILAGTTRPEKAKLSKKRRNKLKSTTVKQDDSPDVTYDGESAEGSLGPDHSEALDDEVQYNLDDMSRIDRDIMQINSPHDTDGEKSTDTSDPSLEPGESSKQSADIPSSDYEEATASKDSVKSPKLTAEMKTDRRKRNKQLRKEMFVKGSRRRSSKQSRVEQKPRSGIHLEGIKPDSDEGDNLGLDMSNTVDQPLEDSGADLEETVSGALLSESIEGEPLIEQSPDTITSVEKELEYTNHIPLSSTMVYENSKPDPVVIQPAISTPDFLEGADNPDDGQFELSPDHASTNGGNRNTPLRTVEVSKADLGSAELGDRQPGFIDQAKQPREDSERRDTPRAENGPAPISSVDSKTVDSGGQQLRDLPDQRSANFQASDQDSKITGDLLSSYF